MVEQKTLHMNKETVERLAAHKQLGDSFNSVLVRLLDRWEGFYGLSEKL